MGRWWTLVLLFSVATIATTAAKKKSVLDYNDADVERIFKEWEENDEDSDDSDSNDPMKAPPPGTLDIEGLQAGRIKPEDLLKQSKKGKPMMIFVGVRVDPPDRVQTDKISGRWVQSLLNAHIQTDRYVVADDRVLLVVKDGSQTWDVKDFLITQTDCTTVSFEQQTFDCASPEEDAPLGKKKRGSGKTEL